MKKTVVVGVSGGIAAYKIPELVRGLRKEGCEVHVMMTRNAREFVTPLTFQTVSNNAVISDMWAPVEKTEVAHISLADKADLMVIAPATANVIAKCANGIADDFLTTTMLATKAPVVIAPAMNVNMYTNPATQHNLRILEERGFLIVGPEKGDLACGWEGRGRMSEPAQILAFIASISRLKDFAGEKVLVTAGPTREPIDPVRYISNHSSGKMGYALAQAACMRGASVTLISGPTSLTPHPGVELVRIKTAAEMLEECMSRSAAMDVVIMAAAVGDYHPAQRSSSKIKKTNATLTLVLERNPDILAEMGKQKGRTVLVGFAAETDDVLTNAEKKLRSKNVDLMVANDLTAPGAGFDTDTNIVTILARDGSRESVPLQSKEQVAHRILDSIRSLKAAGSNV